MKYIICSLLLLFILISCNESKEKNSGIERQRPDSHVIAGNVQTEKRFNELKKSLIIEEDSLRNMDFLDQQFTEVPCECSFLAENDYDDQTENIFIREYTIVISDSVEVRVLQKQGKIPEYIYTYQNKPFKITNFYGEMFSRNSDLFFDFTGRKCYKITENKYLMREQPMTWCGLANQFDVFQIIDLQKMEMIQFSDRDSKIR